MLEKQSLEFLSDLAQNNDRDYFLSQKKRYERYKQNYLELAAAFIAQLERIDAALGMLEPKDCTFRINRDIRFSADKSPYKTHMGIWVSPGHKKQNFAGFYVHIQPENSFLAAGLYWPDVDQLRQVRNELAFFLEDFQQIIRDWNGAYQLDRTPENALKTSPKGFEKDHPALEFLQLKSFTVTHKLSDKDVLAPDFIEQTTAHFKRLAPFVAFLNRPLQ